jgi:hypothetical protein
MPGKSTLFAFEAVQSPDLKLRDTATRAIGKFAECIPATDVSEALHLSFIEKLQHNSPGFRFLLAGSSSIPTLSAGKPFLLPVCIV